MGKSKPTWVAVIVCVIAVIVPGLIAGGLASLVFRMFAPALIPFGFTRFLELTRSVKS
jgi:hypothetical protein